MTQLLEQAIAKLNALSPGDQDAIASLILDELADEERWQESFAKSPEALAKLVEQARGDIQSGPFCNSEQL
jgi:hypothetical protein